MQSDVVIGSAFALIFGQIEPEQKTTNVERDASFQHSSTLLWAGQYAYNTFAQNAGNWAHPTFENFHFANGFFGHLLPQAPAIWRGMAEMVALGGDKTLDLSKRGYDRVFRNEPLLEKGVI